MGMRAAGRCITREVDSEAIIYSLATHKGELEYMIFRFSLFRCWFL